VNRPTYHHGDLRAVILNEAARLVAERGPDGVSLRELARGAGVSHLAYVRFAIDHPGHYRVMFDRSLLDAADTELAAAEAAAGAELSRGVATLRDPHARADPAGAELAAWSLVHGFAMLWLNDAVNAQVRQADPMDLVSRIATMLFEG
jgi:WHG domain-containing protein/tetracycline repressor-like protein